jgi:DNA-binding MarR family transcriptional regulator
MKDSTHHSLADLLMALRRKMSERMKTDPLKSELTFAQFEVLWFLDCAKEERSMESIANHLNIKPPSATSLIDRMEKDGLVSREKDPNDRRIVKIAMTAKTRKQFAALRKQREAAFTKLTSKLSVKDKKEFERILLQLIKN